MTVGQARDEEAPLAGDPQARRWNRIRGGIDTLDAFTANDHGAMRLDPRLAGFYHRDIDKCRTGRHRCSRGRWPDGDDQGQRAQSSECHARPSWPHAHNARGHHTPSASITRRATAAPEYCCWPVIRLPSRTACALNRPATMKLVLRSLRASSSILKG